MLCLGKTHFLRLVSPVVSFPVLQQHDCFPTPRQLYQNFAILMPGSISSNCHHLLSHKSTTHHPVDVNDHRTHPGSFSAAERVNKMAWANEALISSMVALPWKHLVIYFWSDEAPHQDTSGQILLSNTSQTWSGEVLPFLPLLDFSWNHTTRSWQVINKKLPLLNLT